VVSRERLLFLKVVIAEPVKYGESVIVINVLFTNEVRVGLLDKSSVWIESNVLFYNYVRQVQC